MRGKVKKNYEMKLHMYSKNIIVCAKINELIQADR